MKTKEAAALGLSVAVGATLSFLVFAAVFNGLWPLLTLGVLSYPIAAALAVKLGNSRPVFVATALVCPTLPWLLWLFPASMAEVGILRASLWPASVGGMFLLAWLAGALIARIAPR